MAKTLVIKDADFSTNKVTTVTFGTIPCTDFEFDESTITITDFDPVSFGYTVTPENTTDTLSIVSSNTSVVDIVDGELTPVGVGTCTITGTCGSQSDTMTVSVELAYTGDWKGSYASVQNNAFVGDSKAYDASYGRIAPMASDEFASEYDIIYTQTSGMDYKAIKIPANTTKIRVTCTNKADLYTSNSIIWLSDESCGYQGYENGAKFVSEETDTTLKTAGTVVFNVPSGANVFYPQIKLDANVSPETRTATQEAEYLGITIEFLAE